MNEMNAKTGLGREWWWRDWTIFFRGDTERGYK